MVSCSVPRACHHIGKDNLRNKLIILNAAVTELRMCKGNFQAENFEYLTSEMDTICARSFAAPPSSSLNTDAWTVTNSTEYDVLFLINYLPYWTLKFLLWKFNLRLRLQILLQ
jgi:hypothetical protein